MKKTRLIGVLLAGVMAVTGVPQIAEPLTVVSSAAAKLAAPANVKAVVSNTATAVQITWDKVKGADGYRVFVFDSTTKKYNTYKTVVSPKCVVKSLKIGSTLKFQVAAVVKSGSKYTEQAKTFAQSVKLQLPAPTGIKTAATANSVKLSWNKVTNASAYRIYAYNSSTGKYVAYKNVAGTSYTVKNLKVGTYKFKVAALYKSGKTYTAQKQSGVITAKVIDYNKVPAKEHTSGYNYGSTIYPFKHDIEYMKKLNSDFIGWLTIADTPIDQPVVQASNNTFYLEHDFYGRYDYSKIGTTFADYHVPVTSTLRPDNLIIYGHNIRTGVGLAKITNYYPARYGSLNFYLKHPTFKYESAYGGQSNYVVFAGMFVNTEKKHGEVFNYFKFRNFSSESQFYRYFEQVFDRSVFYNPDLDIKYGDKFLTLSTCYYPMGADVDTRFVVFARELRSGEKTVSTANAYTNRSPLYFDYYYKVNGGSWQGRKWSESLMQGYSAWKKKNS